MGPQISVYNASNTSLVSTWNIGVLKAQIPSDVFTINIWNNKGGTTTVSDLKEAFLMVLDSNADTANEDVARDQWIQINEPSIDGNSNVWTPIGGSKGKDIKANADVTDNTISGVANDGVSDTSAKNVCTVNLRAVAPPNSNPGDKAFKIRLTGYFT